MRLTIILFLFIDVFFTLSFANELSIIDDIIQNNPFIFQSKSFPKYTNGNKNKLPPNIWDKIVGIIVKKRKKYIAIRKRNNIKFLTEGQEFEIYTIEAIDTNKIVLRNNINSNTITIKLQKRK